MPDFEVKNPDYEQMTLAGENELQVSWLGHASVLYQIDGVNVLSDPVFRGICGPFKRFGTRKFRDCRVMVEMLPKIHAVMISHDHYDHLDYETVSVCCFILKARPLELGPLIPPPPPIKFRLEAFYGKLQLFTPCQFFSKQPQLQISFRRLSKSFIFME